MFQDDKAGDVFALGLAARDAKWHAARGVPGIGTYVGAEGFAELLEGWTAPFQDYTVQLTEVRDVGDRVLAFAHQAAIGRGSGVSVEMDYAMLVTLRDEVIRDVRVIIDRAEAFEAAGLSE